MSKPETPDPSVALDGTAASPAPARPRWYRRHPKIALALFVIGFCLTLDLTLGAIVIPGVFRCPHPVYHHGLLPYKSEITTWGKKAPSVYRTTTNSLGFRDATMREVPLRSERPRMLIIGDSFGEGIGVPYEDTFVAHLQKAWADRFDVLNASTVSYSPKLYYHKTKFLLDEVGLEFQHLLVFIDISDITNEIAYEAFTPTPFGTFASLKYDLTSFGRNHSFTWYWIHQFNRPTAQGIDLGDDGLFPCLATLDSGMRTDPQFIQATHAWTVDKNLYERWGKRGLKLARKNMGRLAALCRLAKIKLTIAVYPWPQQIHSKDADSIQVRAWQQFAQTVGCSFVNLFPKFVNGTPPQEVEDKYFLAGDVHWNAAGHKLIADGVLEALR